MSCLVASSVNSADSMKWLPVILFSAACTSSSEPEIPQVRSDLDRDNAPAIGDSEFAAFVDANTDFGTEIYRRVSAQPGNMFMSPHSISIALAMTYAGANGTTASQMADALNFTLPAPQLHDAFNKLDLALASRGTTASSGTIPFRLKTANAVFGQSGMNVMAPFLDTLARSYGAGLHVLDFESDPESARVTINDWVEARTNDKILDLLPPASIKTVTRLVLTNAIYFSAAWDEPFEASETADRPFSLGGDAHVIVPTMHQVTERSYGEGPGYKAAEIVYDGAELSMVVVVPDDLASFESTLDAQRMKNIVSTMSPRLLTLELPKFKFDAPLALSQVLKDMGMVDPFEIDVADFSGINDEIPLAIGAVLHKGFVAIDEKGTEAAAATAVIINTDSAGPGPATLLVDRPFVFFIRDRATNAVLFIGRVKDPR